MIDKKIINAGIKFQCQGSSNCCVSRGKYGFVYLSKKDLSRFSNFFNISISSFKKKYCEFTQDYLHLKELNINGNCIFLDKKKCSVYSARPTQCRSWPFWKENLNAKKWNDEIINFCPGIGKGKKYKAYEILKKMKIDLDNDKRIIKESKI